MSGGYPFLPSWRQSSYQKCPCSSMMQMLRWLHSNMRRGWARGDFDHHVSAPQTRRYGNAGAMAPALIEWERSLVSSMSAGWPCVRNGCGIRDAARGWALAVALSNAAISQCGQRSPEAAARREPQVPARHHPVFAAFVAECLLTAMTTCIWHAITSALQSSVRGEKKRPPAQVAR